MNKIFKVIWSKSKQCYIVVSEIAKNKTGKKKIVVASILAALTMTANTVTVEGAIPEGARTDQLGLAIGMNSNSKSNQSVAIGYASSAEAPGSNPENPATAVGAGANANGRGAVALGLSSNATGENAIALGGGANGGKNKTEATAKNSIALGFDAKASGVGATAIGLEASSTASDAIAMGRSANATGDTSISLGYNTNSSATNTVAIGSSVSATAESAIALGRSTKASGTSATAVGPLAVASGSTAAAFGLQAKAGGQDSLAIGNNANASGRSSFAGGLNTVASGTGALALGDTAKANSDRTIAIGPSAIANDADSVAVGTRGTTANKGGLAVGVNANATSNAWSNVALGLDINAKSTSGGAVGVGRESEATGSNSVAMGKKAKATDSNAVGVGYEAEATKTNTVAMGRKVYANTAGSVALGSNATASNTGAIAIGGYTGNSANTTASGNNSVALGVSATANGDNSVAMGRDVTASAESAIAIGKDAVSNKKNAVALGSGSDTSSAATVQSSTTIGGKTYSWNKGVLPTTDSNGRQVSVGTSGFERQIKNVAAGEISANSTDAINGAQLYSVASGLAKDLKVPYVSIKSSATGANSNFDNDGAQGPNSIAIGPSSIVTNQNSIAFGNNAQSLSDDSITIGRNAKAESGSAFTNTSRAIAIGANSKVATNVTQGIAIGSGSITDEGAVVTGDQSIAIGGNVKVDGHSAIAIGGDDARKAAGQQVSYTSTNDVEVTGTLQTAIQNLTGYNLSNYKGTAAGHAGVAYGTSALAGNAGVAIGTAADSMTRKNDKGQVVNNNPVTNAVAIGTGARANFDNSVAIGGGSNTDHYATKQVNAIIDGVEVKWAGGDNISPGDVVSFGAEGFERQLKNVAPGEVSQTSTDAINGSQIYSLARKITNIMNGGAGSVVNVNASGEPLTKVVTGSGTSKVEKYYRTADVKDDGTLVTGAIAQTPTALALVNVAQTNANQQTQTPRTLGNVADGVKDNDAVNVSQLNAAKVKYFSVNSTDSGNRDNTGATGTNAIAIGPTAKSTGDNGLAIGNNAQANSNFAVALGHYANNGSINSTNSISIGWTAGGSSNGASNVAIGTNAGKQITGNNNISLGNTAGTVTNNNVYTSESILLGTEARVKGSTSSKSVNNVIAIGKSAEGSAASATSIGINANASAENAMALGPSSKASVYNGVALGSYSEATTAGGTAGYNANSSRTDKYAGLTGLALTANTGAVSIGSSTKTRQITNLAAGTNDTDAVNVAQLKSVNLAVKGNSGAGGDVNLATNPLTIKGNDDYITTSASGNTVNISGKVQNINVSNGTASATTGMADAKNVADAINKAVSQNAYTWNLTADNDTAGSRSTINKEGTVKFSGDQNITVKRDGNTITSSLNKSIIVDSVKANNSVTTGSGSNQITLDGTTGAVTGKTFSGQSFTAGDNVLSNTTLQIGSPTNGNNVTITKDGLTSKAGTKTAKFGANGIDAGGQQITNVSSGGNVGTNAANITDVKNAVSDVTLNLDTNSKTGTVKLSESPLKVIGANGIRTDLVGTNNGSLVVGLDQATVNATTKGIGLTGDTGSTGLKYLKDGDATFKVAGDGNLVTTKASATGVQVAVDTAKVKDLAVEAVTVSKDTQTDNPITVTPTTGTNSKDYAIGIDTTKLAGKTDLTYRANNDTDANAQKVSLAKGLNFVNGDNTVATVAADGKVSYDLNTATKTKIDDSATAVARNISLGADSGTASSQSLKDGDVAFNVKGATGDYVSTNMNGNTVEISTTRATINSDANTGAASVTGNDGLATAKNVASAINSAVNGLSQNLNISDGTTDSTVALKNQKLTVTGTGAATATVNNQTITVNVAEGTLSNNADGTVKADAAGVATTKNVADVINKSISDNQYSWKLSANGEANTATVGKGDTVDFAGDTNITVDRNNKNISVSLNKNLTDMNSISLGNARGETIFLNGRDGSIKAGKAEFKDNVGAGSTITSDQLSFTNGATGANESTTTIALDTVSIQSGPNNSALTSKYLMFSDEDGNNAEGSAKGMAFQDAAGKMVQFSLDEIKAGGNKIQEVAEGIADTDAVNVKQLKDTVASQTLTYRANTAADADAKSVKLSKGLDFVDGTSTVATVDNDGKVSFDLNTATKTKIDDSATAVARNISLGADSGTASSQSLKDGDVAFNVKGATGDYVSTNMNGNTVEVSTKRATINSNANTGAASVTGNDGLATAKNVADAINKAADAAKAGAAWNLTTNSSTTDKTSVQGGDTVDLINGDNIVITQDGTDKKKITVATKKDLTVDSVTAGNTVINTSGLTNGTTAITGSGITTDKVTVGGISIDKTDGINAGGKAISNVASGGTTDTNAANIGDVKQAVANLSQNLNITDGTNNGTVDLKNQKLNVAGANGVTATVNNQTITVGLDANTVNATTKGIGLTADTGSTGNKYLKDGDVSFAVTGDGNLVSTSATAAGVKVAVDAAKVKDLAVDAVTVSKDAQADNPITVTPTAGTNSKDYAIGIDTTKLAAKTDLTYRANNDTDANAKKVSLAKGLNFVNGTLTTASIDNDGVVKYDVNTAAITAGTDGTVTGPTTDGVATAQNVADTINAAKKAAKTEITANTGEAANATTGNVTLTSTAAADGHTIYDVKLNDKVTLGTGANAVTIDGTAGKATVGTAVVDGVNNTITTGGASPVTLDGATGTITGKTANIGGVTVNGTTNDITGLSNTTVTGADFATKGRAATEEQLKAVTGATALKFTGDVATNTGSINLKDDTFGIKGDGKYITTDVNGKDVNLTVSEAEVKKSAVAAVTVSTDTTDANNPISVTPTTSADGTTKDYKVTIDGTKIANKTNLSYKANDGTAKQVSLADGLNFKNGTLTTASIDDAGVVKYDVNTATITAGTDGTITGPTTDGVATAQNVADAINAAKKAAKTEITANTGEAANATTGNVTLTSTTAADGHTIYDVKLKDTVILGTGANAVTIDGTAGKVTAKNAVIGGVTVDGDNSHVTGLSNTTWNGTATTGRAATEDQLKAVADTAKATTDAVNLKFSGDTNTSAGVVNLKDDTFNIVGDGKYVTTDANGKDLTVKVSEAEVKKSAVAAVTVSTDTTDTNNPISVTPTTSADGTTKDYKVTIDGTKIANKTNLSYKANDGTAKQVSLADGLNFKNGTLTTASIDDAGIVKYDVNTATITAGTDGTITGPTTDGVATAQNVADAINAAKKAAKTEITANTGEAANATTGNVTLTSTTAADGHTIYDVKLNDKVTLGTGANAVTIDGTAGKATVGTAVVDGVNNTITTGGASPVTLDGATGTITGKTANIGGVTVNGTTNDITGLSNTTVTGADFATKGRAATEEQLKAVTGATALKFTGDVATNTGSINLKDDTFGIKGDGKYITTDVNGKDVNLTVSEAEVKKSAVAAVTVSTDTTDANNPISVTPTTSADGTTKDYKVTIDGTKIANKTNLSYKANDGTAKQVSLADGLNFKNGTLTTASIDDAGVVKYDVNTATITAGTDGTITGPTTDGVATAQNVADAINAAKKAAKTEITANTGEAANATTGNVTLTSTTAADGHTIYDVKLNDKVTLGTGANAVTIDGTAGKATVGTAVVDGVNNTITTGGANAVTLDGATAKVTAGVTTVDGVTGTITTGGTNSVKVDGATGTVTGLTNKDWTPGVTKAVTGRAATEDQLQKVADAASSQTWNITADKAGTTGAQTGTKKNATVGKDQTVELVAGDNLAINQDERKFTYSLNKDLAGLTSVSVGTGTTETIKLDGATGKVTAKNAAIGGVTVDGDNSHVTGLSNTTWNGTATTGRAATENQLKAVADTAKATTDAVNLKFSGDTNTSAGVVNLKDDTFNIVGDGKYVTTDANGKDLTVKVSEAEVKKSAVAAVTVSTDTTDTNNPISVTPTTSADGTTKDYKVTIDGTKIANKTNLSYKANDGTAKQVSLADGLNFKNGTLTTASIDDAGVVKYDVNTATITAGTDGTITGPTTDGVATAQNVADAINAAKKAAKTEITANTGEAANATTGNVTLTSTTAADGHTIYDVKLNDKVTLGTGANAVTIDGTAGKATIGSSVVDGVNNTITTGGANAVALDGAAGTVKTGTVTVTGGTTNDITGLSNTTVNSADFATKGRAATEEQLKKVGEQTWQITADKDATTSGAQTGTKKDAKVGKDDKVQLIAGENLTVNQNERDFTYSLNKDLVKMNSATFEATGGKTTVITGDSIAQTDGTKTNTSTAAGNTVADGGKSTATTADGTTVTNGADSTATTAAGTTVTSANGNTNYAADGVRINTTGKNPVSLTDAGLDNGNNVIKNVASGHVNNDDTDNTNAANIADVKKATTTVTANNGEAANATTGNVTLTSTTAADGHTIYDVKLNDKVTLGTGANAVTIDGTAGKATIGSSVVDGVNNTITTGGANAVALDGAAGTVKTGTVTVTGGTTNDITGLSNTTVNAADFATKGRAATEEQLKAVGEQTWQITADKDATTSGNQTGTKKDAKVGKDDKVQLIAGENLTVNQNERDFTYSLNKDLVKMNSATFEATGGKTTVITGNSIAQTDGTKTNRSTAAGNTVADGTKSTETTAAGQVIKDGAKTNTSTVDENTLVDGAKSNKTTVDSNVIDDGNGNVNTSNATSNTITDGTNTSTITAGKATIGSSIIDGVNNTITTGGANAVALDGAAGTVKTGTVTVSGGTTNDITGLSNTTVNSADFATKGRAATEEQLKAVGEQTWQITADKDATTSGNQTGTKKDAKVGKDDKVQLIAGENLTVNQNERDFTYSLNKDLVKMNSATFEATGGKTTIITGDSIAQTDGTKTNTSTAAGNTVVDGGKSTATTADGTTVTNGADTTATTAAGTTVTNANGNTKYAADGVRINTTGKNPVSLTDAGLDNGNNVIKNVASGHVNNDDTDNTNAANIADVKKATTTVTANNGEAANATTGNVTLTSTTAADGHTIYDVKLNDKVTLGTGANAVTIDGTAGKATIGSSVVDGVNNTFTTGGANAVKLDGAAGTVKTGTVTVTGGTTNDITGLSNTTVNSADFATKGRAATEEQLKKVGEQTWQITADKDATTSGAQTGTKKDAKVGKDDKVQLIAGENLTVNQNERDFTYSLNKDLVKMNSATFEATGGKTTVITGNSIAQTDGTKTNRSTAAGNTVADGTKSTETTAAGQVIKDGAKTNTSTVDENTLVDGAKSNKTTVDSNVIDDGNGNVNTSNATSNTIANGADSTATTAAGTTVTSANGNTNYAADGVRINTTGKNPVSLTDAGLDNGNNVIKNVASGHVNNDDTDNTNAANIADVKKATTTVTANNGEAANATTGNVTLTSTTAADGHTIYDVKLNDKVTLGTGANAVTIDGTAGKATIGSSVVDGVNNTITTGGANAVNLDGAAGKATIGSSVVDGVNNTITTGGANAVALDGAAGTVKTGTVTVTGGTTNDITGLSNTTVNSADFATKGRAATEEQLKQVGEQTWQITADKDATTSGAQTGTKKDAKVGKDDKVQLIAGENLTVNQNERDFTYSLNKDLVKMNSATFEATGGKTTVITGDSIAQTDGTKTNTSTAAGNTVVDGGKSTATTADGTTVTNGADTTATTAAGTTVTNANGNTKYAADGVRINTTGKNPVSLTDAGLDNGNNVIKNVASGHVNNDDTDNTNAANIADVKKATTTVTANNGEAANATTGNVTLTSTTAADGHTIYDVKLNDKVTLGTGANAVTIDGTAGKATIGSSVVDGVNNTITTGGANAVALDGAAGTVKTGTVTVTGGTTNDITGLSNTTVNSADFATKGRAATEEQLKQVGEQTWQITADKDATTSGAQTGTKKDAKVGKDDKVQLIAGENLTVNQNERDFTYSLNKDLVKMNSATFEATGGKTTVITGNSIAQTDGTKTNRSTAAGNTVADGTKSTETTAAGQVIKDGAKTNTSTVDENTLVDGAKSNKTTVDSNVIDDGNGNVNTSKATSNTITDGTNTTEATASTVTVKDNAGNSTVITKDTITTGTGANKVTVDGTVGKVTAGSAVIDGVNNTITTGGANTVKLDGAAGTVTGLTNTAWTPGVTKAVSGRAATEDQLQQVSDAVGAGWNINSGTVAGSTGEANGSAKTKISSGEEVQLQAGNNLIIDQNGKTLAYSLNKNLKDMESAIFNATGGKTTVIKGDSIVQTDGGKTNTSNAAGNTVVDGTKSTATTAAGTTITDGAKTNTNTADKNVIDDGAGNTNTSNATSNTIADPNGNTNTATATSNTLADNAGNSNVSNATSNNLTDNAGNSNVSNATSNTLKNAAGDETKVDAKGATVKDAAGNTTNVAATGATVTNAAGDTTKVEATGTTVADAAGNKATFTKDGVTITKPGKDTVSLTGNGLDNGNNKIVNVADGTNDTDAVNVRQLDAKTKAATTELTANGGESADNTTGNIVLTKTTAPDGHIVYDNKLNDKITLGAADPTKAITVDGTNGTIKAGKDGNAVAINGTDGTIKAGDGTNAVAIDGVNGSVKVADKIALNGKDGKAAIGTVGIDGKDGIITTGGNNPVAVNGKDGVVTGLTNKTWDPNNITSGRAATEDQVQSAVANAGWDATVGTEGSGVNSTPSATPEKIRPNETLTFKAGNNMMVSHAGKTISYAVNPELTDMKSATFKDAAGNTTVTNGNGMTITPGSANPNNPNAGPVSLTKDGLNNGNNQIKGVAPGSDDTDAVNIGQLKASNAKIGDAIGQVAGEVQRVGAHAAAMAALKPIQYDPLEPTQVMAGVGNYRGETAAALGLAHYTNENTMFNVGVSVGGNHNMVNAGVTHKFGYSPEKKNIPDRYKAGPISSVYVMQDEVSSLKKENAEQKYVIADQAARLNTLEAENERQRQELAETKQGLDDLRAAVDRLLASKG